MKHDRITELYEGDWGSFEGQRLARERIHWICAQAEGPEVLDIGCSQGIASILLAREGKRMTGVDVQAASIEFAEERRSGEEDPVRDRLRFAVAEASNLPFEDASFDTVLLGEVLEHLIDVGPPLAEARRVLRSGGQLVVTSPYGISRSHDHKEPLYLAPLLELLASDFDVEHYHVIDGPISSYFGLVARHTPNRPASAEPWRGALGLAERRLAHQDRTVEDLRQELATLRSHPRPANEQALKERNQALRTKLDERGAQVETLKGRLEAQTQRSEEWKARALELTERLDAQAAEGGGGRRGAQGAP